MFLSSEPPVRIIGVEDEYDIQIPESLTPRSSYSYRDSISTNDYISKKAIEAAGIISMGSYIENGGKIYQDVGHAEYCTPECLGPYQAAAADIAGMHVLASVVESSGIEHNGLYRISGTWKNETTWGTTNGVHENFMAPASIASKPLLTRLLTTYYATRVATMAGTIAHNKYIFSQKEHGIGGRPIERNLVRRTSHGTKPMALVLKEEPETVGTGWLRLETRYADSPISLASRRHALATTSLILRIIEHENLFNENEFDNLLLDDPVTATHRFMRDLTLRKTAEVRSGDRLTMLDIQEQLAEKALHLCEHINLPEDEVDAAHTWVTINDAFRRSNPAMAEYDSYLLRDYGVATKHYWLNRIDTFSKGDAESKTRSMQWDRVLPIGNGIAMMNKAKITDTAVQELQLSPPPTRAAMRQKFILENHSNLDARVVNWSTNMVNGIQSTFSDPYGYIDE